VVVQELERQLLEFTLRERAERRAADRLREIDGDLREILLREATQPRLQIIAPFHVSLFAAALRHPCRPVRWLA
jgi:hypothetical protein